MTRFLARISARNAVAVVAIWGALAIAGGVLADDAGLGLNFGFTDVLDNATTTEMKLSGRSGVVAGREPAGRAARPQAGY